MMSQQDGFGLTFADQKQILINRLRKYHSYSVADRIKKTESSEVLRIVAKFLSIWATRTNDTETIDELKWANLL